MKTKLGALSAIVTLGLSQVEDARVFAGFHFRFSVEDAAVMERQIATYDLRK